MWTLIKAGFWFSLVLVLLPFADMHPANKDANAPQVQLSDAISAASGAYDYVSRICLEKPEVCVKGAQTANALGFRAREGARIAYEYLDKKFADQPAQPAAATSANGIPAISVSLPAAHKPATAATEPNESVLTGSIIPIPMKRPKA